MAKIVRLSNNPYKWTTGLQPLGDIAPGFVRKPGVGRQVTRV